MSKILMTCLECGENQQIRRFELIRAHKPHCRRCGGPLGMSKSGRESLAEINDAQRGETLPKRKKKEEPKVQRILPIRETKRYEFWEHPSLYTTLIHAKPDLVEELKQIGPNEFYLRVERRGMLRPKSTDLELAGDLIHMAERKLYLSGRPYYKVWPSIAEALCHTEMRIDGEFFHIPFDGIEIRFPKTDNPLAPARALVAARIPGEQWTDGRSWSFVIAFVDGPEYDADSLTWVADIPIRPGLSLEDALDQTQLQKHTPYPDLMRRIMRVAVGICFFGIDRHEVILPEVPRRIIDRYQKERRNPSASEAAKILRQAKEDGLFGWKVGSEITLPSAVVHNHPPQEGGEHRELTAGHIRRGHMAMIPCGKGKQDRKLIFRFPTVVRPDLPLQSTHGYRVKIS